MYGFATLALPGLFTPRGSWLRCRHCISADEVSIPLDVLGSRDRNGANGAKLLSDGWGGANNLLFFLNPEQVWAISNWVRCCGCRKVAHKSLDFCKTRDPQKRSKKDVTSHASLDIPRMTSDFYRPHGHPHKETRIARSQVRWVWCMGPPLQAPHLQRWEKFIWIARGRCGNGRTGALQQWCSNSRESPKSTATTRCKLGAKCELCQHWYGESRWIKCVLHALCTGWRILYSRGSSIITDHCVDFQWGHTFATHGCVDQELSINRIWPGPSRKVALCYGMLWLRHCTPKSKGLSARMA